MSIAKVLYLFSRFLRQKKLKSHFFFFFFFFREGLEQVTDGVSSAFLSSLIGSSPGTSLVSPEIERASNLRATDLAVEVPTRIDDEK